MTYETKGALKFAEKDIFAEGCVSDGAYTTFVGYSATPGQLERWKTGDCELWYCVYSFQFDEVIRKTANFNWVAE